MHVFLSRCRAGLVIFCALAILSGCASGPRIDRSLSTPDQSSRARYLILHYTVSDTPASIRAFTAQAGVEVSVHYLLTDQPVPVIYNIVDESRAAYQAGSDSGWKNDRSLNLTSIGIEIVNAGWVEGPGGKVWAPFPKQQIDTLIPLVKDIMSRHRIKPENVLGHSDIAPQRKQDPGALFPWRRLAAEGIVPWPEEAVTAARLPGYAAVLPDIAWFQKKLAAIGYVVPQDGVEGVATRNVMIAYQTHYRPANIDGVADAETAALLDSPLVVRTASKAGAQ